MGNELGRIDGNIRPQTRRAIGIWQAKNDLPPTTYLTREQLAFLVVQTNPMMEPCVPDMPPIKPVRRSRKSRLRRRSAPSGRWRRNPANNSRSFRNGASARPWCGGTILRRPRITTS
ncbi:peptidoglycan-binding domain-containing protein [Mesorhizobium sp. M0408]|uniref:peptidoglycan-binding domain-containing protein n=1 Tax=unclassified Mesorhizobium TaxID=325217 RepID=UPI00333AFF47